MGQGLQRGKHSLDPGFIRDPAMTYAELRLDCGRVLDGVTGGELSIHRGSLLLPPLLS